MILQSADIRKALRSRQRGFLLNPFRFGAGGGGPTDPNFANVSLLLHMNGTNGSTTFTDNSSNAFTPTVNGNAQISTAQSKFGGASGLFDGTGDYLSYATSTAFGFGSGQYTIECWIWIPSLLSTTNYMVDIRKSGGSGVGFLLNASEQLQVVNNAATILTGSTALAINTWYHAALTRDSGNTLRLFLNGTVDGSVSDARTMDATCDAFVGATLSGTGPLNGRIDDLRITKGVARYTANFTAPTAAFPDS